MPGFFGPSAFILWGLVAAAFVIALRQPGARHRQGVKRGVDMLLVNGPRICVAILAAGFISELLPQDLVAAWLGADTGWRGIVIGCAVGPFFPGGPLVIMPLVLALFKAGAGVPALIALLATASTWGLHRILMFEIPMMGGRFTALRLVSSIAIPPLAGLFAAFMVAAFGAPAPVH
ncbi:MAG: hypothetical protein R3229_07155 [Alphaproteobacteria bacterium]|nr:hypothetical protein [Alphaproteobacteria bacterium]